MRNYPFCIIIYIVCSFIAEPATAASSVLCGSTYNERAQSLINHMLQTELKQPESIKYLAPFYFARLYRSEKTDQACARLLTMYNRELTNREDFYKSGSNMDFCAHATMHGYLLTKEQMTDTLRHAIRSFMEMGRYIRKNVTLNMRMMTECAGYMCAQEWPDFIDADGNNAEKIHSTLRDSILATIRKFVTDNCPEADAFTYIGTNMQYLRMLAEFCSDEEVRSAAENAYQHIIAQMLLPWNRGLYCSNPPRSKGWDNLQTGNRNANVQIGLLAWLFYGAIMFYDLYQKLLNSSVNS